ncbi:DUF3300 domain-containing protein [Sulfitobacter sp. D35]|uniref:DUF3300 domain-containing protein n=1 Tax=Sulfitobacter sp. D35 TaxID=3083252 RepID=UPI00296F20B5|nr:DUF3300 domain-containing protein [Sulfitobacter sp. D35]MDW4497230.1 DUF3300 domain-containing protein [Sulfitobacter sp. D35]
MFRTTLKFLAGLAICAGTASFAQDSDEDALDTEIADEDLLDTDELSSLVAPVALYPDTLLVQVLVAATSPLDVVKANRLVEGNADADPQELEALIADEDWDESVGVLAEAFPDVLSDMAEHLEWTEAMGTAMLAQSDDVMAAVQELRKDAVQTGALESGEEQQVEVTETQDVVIQPTDPQVVYVPQYEAQQVFPATYGYADTNYGVGDALMTGAVAFGTYALIDEIFDDDDDWNDYWGCRNCGGWGGGPIIHDPDIDLDVDGNVNIGNRVNIDKDTKKKLKQEWKADERKRKDARKKIKNRKNADGKSKLHTEKHKSRGDKVRENISKSGNRDLAAAVDRPNRDGNRNNRPNADRPNRGDTADRNRPGNNRPNANRPDRDRPETRPAQRPKPKVDRAASNRPKTGASNSIKRKSKNGDKAKVHRAGSSKAHANRPATQKAAAKPAVKKPAAQKPAVRKAAAKPAQVRRPAAKPAVRKPTVKRQASRPAMHKTSHGHVSRASSSRGHKSRGGKKRRR